MEERNTSGDFLATEPSISTWETIITATNGPNRADTSSYCDIISQIMILRSLIVALVGIAVNAIVLWFLGFRMHRNAFSVYFLNLAGADFLFLCFQFLYCLLGIIYMVFSIFIPTPSILILLKNVSYLSGLSMLSAISLEGCLSVMWPIWYHCRRPRHTSAIICALLWALSLLLNLLEGKECGHLFTHHVSDWCQASEFITGAWLSFLILVLLESSLALVIIIFCGSRRIPVARLYVTILLTVLVFLLSGLPHVISCFLSVLMNLNGVLTRSFYPVTVFLSCVNSCVKPIIYFFIGSIWHHEFQGKTLKLLLQRAFQDIPEEEEHRGGILQESLQN